MTFEKCVDWIGRRFADVSYMQWESSERGVMTDGRLSDMDPANHGGSWTDDNIIYVNPDLTSVIANYGVDMPVMEFAAWIICHELSHELWQYVLSDEAKRHIVSTARSKGFSTAYLKTVKPEKLDKEMFCEYIASMMHSDLFSPVAV